MYSLIRLENGFWLPKDDRRINPVDYYQQDKIDICLGLCDKSGLAIDIGAHIGLWSKQLSAHFDKVVAFEPIKAHRDCFILNAPDAELLPYALGRESGRVNMNWRQAKSEVTSVATSNKPVKGVFHSSVMETLDSFGLAPSFIKIDCEGYEPHVILGGIETIKRYKPDIFVEQKSVGANRYGLKEREALVLLEKMGYRLIAEIRGDFFMRAE